MIVSQKISDQNLKRDHNGDSKETKVSQPQNSNENENDEILKKEKEKTVHKLSNLLYKKSKPSPPLSEPQAQPGESQAVLDKKSNQKTEDLSNSSLKTDSNKKRIVFLFKQTNSLNGKEETQKTQPKSESIEPTAEVKKQYQQDYYTSPASSSNPTIQVTVTQKEADKPVPSATQSASPKKQKRKVHLKKELVKSVLPALDVKETKTEKSHVKALENGDHGFDDFLDISINETEPLH